MYSTPCGPCRVEIPYFAKLHAEEGLKGLRVIGDLLVAGDPVAKVDEAVVCTRVAGVLRGIVRTGVTAQANLKIADVDPRGDVGACFTISDKSRNISGSVLEAILRRFPLVRR